MDFYFHMMRFLELYATFVAPVEDEKQLRNQLPPLEKEVRGI